MLKFMIARDHMHQLQWLAAIEEFGRRDAALPTPSDFPLDQEYGEYAHAFMAYSQNPDDTRSGEGPWEQGPAPDSKGQFTSPSRSRWARNRTCHPPPTPPTRPRPGASRPRTAQAPTEA